MTTRTRPARWLLATLFAAGCASPTPLEVSAVDELSRDTAVLDVEPEGDSDYALALAALEAQIEATERDSERYPGQWARIERVAARYAARARLTGSLRDYARADATLADAFAVAPEGSGPLLTRAYLSFTLHRLPAVEPDLAQLERRIIVPEALRAQILSMRGDVMFHQGRFEEAEALHREAEEMAPDAGNAFRVAYDLWQTARFDAAERWIDVAEGRVGPDGARERAWLSLQRGLMDLDRGRHREALEHYRHARALFSGWWLIDEHMAEIHALEGDLETAEAAYRDLVVRTGNPEFVDALAGVLDARGAHEEAAAWRARARASFEEQLAMLPEASYGHALDHFLVSHATERALELARANHALRPGGEATMKLAQALFLAGRPEEGWDAIEPMLDAPYETAELHATAARLCEALGDPERAATERAAATAIHPTIFDQLGWLAR